AGFGEVRDFELARALLDLALERGIRFLQPCRHAIELLPERLELIAGLDRDALVQLAAADPRRAGAEGAYRHNHFARKQESGKKCQGESGKERDPGADHAVVERRIGLLDRHLGEYQPTERSDRRIGAEYLSAPRIDRNAGTVRRLGRLLRASGLDLRSARQIGIAQHEADIRMGDEATLLVDDISLAAPADLDLRHHVPDEFEIHPPDDHAMVRPRAG